MRVITGAAKGRKLVGPDTRHTRPMTDRNKEALFSALGDLVVGAAVLDLYAGVGSLGIEALSRGASSAVFVEREPEALSALRANLTATGLEGRVVAADVSRYLESAAGSFRLVFIDPPWSVPTEELEPMLWSVAPLVEPEGLVVVTRHHRDPLPRPRGGLRLMVDKRYGEARIARYVKDST